jgi:hypothetical protein
MLFEQSRAKFEMRLVVTLSQLIKDQQPRCVTKGAEGCVPPSQATKPSGQSIPQAPRTGRCAPSHGRVSALMRTAWSILRPLACLFAA